MYRIRVWYMACEFVTAYGISMTFHIIGSWTCAYYKGLSPKPIFF